MNYLAHIHLAHLTNTSLLGNFLGDFVKGSKLHTMPVELQRGIRLHRAIDTFTDQHSSIRHLKRQFPNSIRRMSGVSIDIYFDHLLSTKWQSYSEHGVCDVLDQFYTELASNPVYIEGRFNLVKEGLLAYRWLHDYAKIESIERAFYQIERRLNHRVSFAHESMLFIESAEPAFAYAFAEFYPALIDFCHEKNREYGE